MENQTESGSPSGAATLFSVFDECLNIHPFLLIEVGYNRVTDWMVTIFNASGVGIKNAPIVIATESNDRDEAMLEAAEKLREMFLPENEKCPDAGATEMKP